MPPFLDPAEPRLHVFAVSDGAPDLPRGTFLSRMEPGGPAPDDAALSRALGAPLDASRAEVFAVSDIAPMRLRDYLAEAHEADRAALDADAARLDGLSGDVIVLTPGAAGRRTDLSPMPAITHVGAYPVPSADHAPRPMPAAAPSEPPRPAPPEPPAGRRMPPARIALIVLGALVAAALIVALL